MIPLPEWAQFFLKGRSCPYCKSNQRIEWVCGVGVREIDKVGSQEIDNGNAGLSYEYLCPNCGRQSTTIINPQDQSISASDIIREIAKAIALSLLTDDQPVGTSTKSSNSKISNKEFEDIKSKLGKMSHEDFMRYIGVPPDQIEKYSKPDPDDNIYNA